MWVGRHSRPQGLEVTDVSSSPVCGQYTRVAAGLLRGRFGGGSSTQGKLAQWWLGQGPGAQWTLSVSSESERGRPERRHLCASDQLWLEAFGGLNLGRSAERDRV